jgi:BioD-like phosphotransacetylase family protein
MSKSFVIGLAFILSACATSNNIPEQIVQEPKPIERTLEERLDPGILKIYKKLFLKIIDIIGMQENTVQTALSIIINL